MENLREPSADSNGTYLKTNARGKSSALATVTTTATAAAAALQAATTTSNGADRTDTAADTQDSCSQLNWLQHLNSNNNNNNFSTNVSTTGKEKCSQVNAVEATKWDGVVSGSAHWPSAQNSWHCVSCESDGAAVVADEGAAAALQHKHNTVAATATTTTTTTTTTVDSQPTAAAAALGVALMNMEDRGVSSVGAGVANTNGQTVEQTQSAVRHNGATISQPTSAAAAAAIAIPTPTVATSNVYDAYAAIGAASLSPPGASGQSHSQRSNSPHNSTENLSYSSDNFYPDNLILLEEDDDDDVGHCDLVDDDDVEAEEISLNSDDCVYAYRGDGADFDLALDAIAGRGAGDVGLLDDETDFLEMDFEPDPLSEVEYGSVETAPAHADAFLLQRDSCHLSGRHSATLSLHACTPTQRQLFSSPIDDDLAPPPAKGLQSQLLMSKNFARITMHLDQIKGENGDCGIFERTHSDRASVLGMLSDDTSVVAPITSTTTAHSLPNALLTSFGRDMRHAEEAKSTPSKVTGAKPKRLSTFSTSSSTSSKTSSKSRQSLRSSYATAALCSSSSFDERSVSCTEFRCVPPASAVEDCLPPPATVANSSNGHNCDDFSANDETCLDCLEKEFLANTIGKAIDLSECPKCRKRSGGMALYKRVVHAATTRCRSGSPAFFSETRDDCLFATAASDFLGARKTDEWTTPIKDRTLVGRGGAGGGGGGSVGAGDGNGGVGAASTGSGIKARSKLRARARSRTCDVADVLQLQAAAAEDVISQRRTTCDNLNSEQLLKNLLLTEKEVVTISTLNLSEETLVQALDKLNISYNAELVKSHFKSHYIHGGSCNANTYAHRNLKEYKDLKHFLLHESKKNCNYPKLKRLIEVATRQQLDVQYKQDANNAIPEMVPVKVADILHQWVRTKKFDVLKQLDKRFVDANVLGKIANIIRQAQQRCTPRRPLPEYISIPQYYASGYLTLTKKC